MKDKNIKFPPIGMRITKSAIGVFLGFVIYYLRGGQGTPFYTALSVLWCMQPYVNDTKEKAFQRTIGTFIGAFYGTIMILLEFTGNDVVILLTICHDVAKIQIFLLSQKPGTNNL